MDKAGVVSLVRTYKCYIGLTALACALTVSAHAQGITVDAPANVGTGTIVNSPFYIQAEATTCQTQPVVSMAYSFDSGSDVKTVNAQSLQAMAQTSNGAYTLYVKSWGNKGAGCYTSIPITVGGGVNVSAPAANAITTSPFVLEAQATKCGGENTSSMAYSINSNTPTTVNATSIDTPMTDSTGTEQIVRVKAWGSSGTFCETDVPITVATTAGLYPSGNTSYANMDTGDPTYTQQIPRCGSVTNHNVWQTQPDCYAGGQNGNPSATGSTTLVSGPVFGTNPQSREYTETPLYVGGGVRWFDAKAAQDSATHFQYDTWVNIPDITQIMNIELDVNHALTSPAGTLYILAVQCALQVGYWQITIYGQGWKTTDIPCTTNPESPGAVTSGVWHHFQIQTHHAAYPGTTIYYDAISVDGNTHNLTCNNGGACQSTEESSNWGGVIGPNFQLDGVTVNDPGTAYTNNLTIYYW